MVFSSLIFLFQFLPATLIVYYLSPPKLRNAVLLAASLVFYAWGEPFYVFVMLFSTLFNYAVGLMVEKHRERPGIANGLLIGSLIVNLGVLFFFKYAGFVAENLNRLLHLHLQTADLPLPLGISFYAFQTMSYVIDVYRRKVTAQRNLISFGTYVAMFPQLVAGPIVKYGDIARQLIARHMTLERFGRGAELFIRGLAKKRCWPTRSACCGRTSKRRRRENSAYFPPGSEFWRSRCKFTSTSADTPTWPAVSGRCSGLIL
ncbi:hypothetical protein HMSSN139_30260 [Paenibacillus sp. HMSSN-139]|nr:hypothetical protein HMSSN139_30260 [Paenibacillus sp. HMSSN-139]